MQDILEFVEKFNRKSSHTKIETQTPKKKNGLFAEHETPASARSKRASERTNAKRPQTNKIFCCDNRARDLFAFQLFN